VPRAGPELSHVLYSKIPIYSFNHRVSLCQ
jgi:hypothetical protein